MSGIVLGGARLEFARAAPETRIAMPRLKRRHFLIGAAGVAGAFVVGWLALPPRQRLMASRPLPTAPGEVALNGWVKVSQDNSVTLMMSQAEMGQGAHTGLAMLLADEMDLAVESVRLEQAGYDGIYNNQAALIDSFFDPEHPGLGARLTRRIVREIPGLAGTGGSSSIKDQWLPVREAGAAARAMLIAAAAELWGVRDAECRTDAGRVSHGSGRSATYGELAALAGARPLPRNVTLKTPAQWKLIGQSAPRIDSAAKTDGSAKYALDARPPELLYASIRMCPTSGGRVARFDAAQALAVPGVRKVVATEPIAGALAGIGKIAGGVAVIADRASTAMRALKLVRIEWDHGAAAAVSSESMFADLKASLDGHSGHAHLRKGDVELALAGAAKTLEAEYRVPLLAHACMEPMNATVAFKDGTATVWAATQAAGFARTAVAKALNIHTASVTVKVPYLGGGFGRRYFSDPLVQAALLARESEGRPVQLIWPREEDITHDYYRPAFLARCRGGLDGAGNLIAWKMTSAGSSFGAPAFADTATDGASDTAYSVPNVRIAHQSVEPPLPLGIWRSVNHSQNAFFVESFLDEAAAAAHAEPIAYREKLLASHPRHLRVLRRLQELCGSPSPPGRARGFALHPSFGSIVAEAAEVSVNSSREIRVHRVVCVIDCGVAVNPNLIRQQLESGIVFGLGAALHGEITLANGQVQQSNFHDYIPLRMYECPEIQTEIIADGTMPGGVGEVGTPPIAPAVANAVFALTRERLRTLPLRLA
ncbi:MAG TPA: molybdopterin cofactor-binding domain-containing protein [Steroidobacteraceae bacterium]|nr:molybdopterin cofactor-binding domain-containing protein [Steroidobacteraceae bacterium]